MNRLPFRSALAGALLLAATSAQTSFVVPSAAAGALANAAGGFPFSYTAYVRLQQAIGTTHFPGPVMIHAIALRSKGGTLSLPETQNQGMSVTLSDSALAPNALSTSYAANISGTPKVVFNSTFNIQRPNASDPLEFNTLIPFATPYLHLNVNPLLIDLAATSFMGQQCNGGGNGTGFDYSSTDPNLGTVYGKSSLPCPSVPPGPGGFGAGGFVIKFFVTNALYPFGKACAGTSVPQISSTGTPTPGSTSFAIQLSGAPTGTPSLAALLLGASSATWGSQALPWALTSWNMPSCFLTVSLDLTVTTGVGAGFAAVGLPIPNTPGLVGQSLFAQWFSIANGANPMGAVTTQGGIVTIR